MINIAAKIHNIVKRFAKTFFSKIFFFVMSQSVYLTSGKYLIFFGGFVERLVTCHPFFKDFFCKMVANKNQCHQQLIYYFLRFKNLIFYYLKFYQVYLYLFFVSIHCQNPSCLYAASCLFLVHCF